jgi:hypothetical protein
MAVVLTVAVRLQKTPAASPNSSRNDRTGFKKLFSTRISHETADNRH